MNYRVRLLCRCDDIVGRHHPKYSPLQNKNIISTTGIMYYLTPSPKCSVLLHLVSISRPISHQFHTPLPLLSLRVNFIYVSATNFSQTTFYTHKSPPPTPAELLLNTTNFHLSLCWCSTPSSHPAAEIVAKQGYLMKRERVGGVLCHEGPECG